MPAADGQAGSTRSRIVLLGASNLTLGVSTITQLAHARAGGPCAIHIALGHGRSYGQWSSILGRRLPGILECDLWSAIEKDDGGPTYALITDVGNDIAYCVEPETIGRWLAEAVSRLRAMNASIVMTALPIESLRGLGRRRFELFRRLYFPSRPLTWDMMRERVEALDAMMRSIAHCSGVAIAEQSGAWYGFDPIHLRMRHWTTAWSRVLALWSPGAREPAAKPRTRPLRWTSLLAATPAERILWGMEQSARQPVRVLRDGTTVSFY